ncbi:TetR/AcrR family transcriptional regulator [Geodermatophilus sp. SYSU D00691]
MSTRLSRTEQVERNRALLLDAARTVFLERGYAGATLEAIAEEAGFSKGVVYSQFAGKADLFLALLERRIAARAEENARAVADGTGPDRLRALMATSARDGRAEAGWARLLIEFRLVAARDPELNARYAALHTTTLDRLAAAIAAALDGEGSGVPPRTLARLVLALGSGAVLEEAADPGALPVELLQDVVVRLTTSS